MRPRTFWTWWCIGAGLWVAMLAFVAPWDLKLSIWATDRSALIAKMVARYGEWPGWAIIICALFVIWHGRDKHSRFRQLLPLAWAIFILAVIEPLLVTQTLKYFWGRVRFRNLVEGYQNYTPFYIPAGIGIGKSFPSGHVAMAFITAPIAFFLGNKLTQLKALFVWSVVILYGSLVIWGRILDGAHYLTDTLFSAGLCLLFAALLIRFIPANKVR
jgi:membrane-associated phospholipid phosphatase